MRKSIVISVPHRLGLAEAQRRVATEIEQLRNEYISKFAHSEIAWAGNSADIRVVALMQEIKGRIDVLPDSVHIEIILPWLLAKIAAPLQEKLTTTTRNSLALGPISDKS
jgi:hypothetical protein